jgi:hypothetical protein
MIKYVDFIEGANGQALAGVSVLVQQYPSGANATLYSDEGVTLKDNPVTTDSTGKFEFYAADGHYTLQISGAGISPQTVTDVVIADVAAIAEAASASAAASAASASAASGSESNAATSEGNAAGSASAAATSAADADTARGLAQSAATDSITARDIALAAQRIFATTAAGIAATVNNDYFFVVSAAADKTLELWKNVATVATDTGKRFPDLQAVTNLLATPVPGVEHAIHDSNDNASEYIEPSTGKRYMLAVDANSVNGIPRTVLSRAVHKAANLGATYIGIPVYGQSKAIGNGGSVHTLPASFGYAQDADGFFDCKMFSANGTATAGPRAQEGSGTAAQNHDSLIAYEERPTSGSSPSGNFETPLGNCMRMVKRLMRDELGITSSNSTHIFIGSAPGQSNTTLAGLSRGTVPYNNLLADITYGKQLANAAGGSYTVKAIVLFHGDADDTAGTSRATYTTTLQTLQANLTTDINLITGDTDDIYLILSQFSSMSQLSPTIALAQRDAAMAANSKIILAGCEYASEHAASNNVHFSGIGYAHQGAYAGLAYERVIVERQTWVNAIPTVKRYGAFLRVTYPDTGYPWTSSATLFPSVANLGFTVVNTDKVTDNPIVGVTQVGPRDFDVHITNQVAGYLRYGFSSWGGNIHDTCDIDPGTAREVTLYRPASICEEQFL